MSDKNRDYEEFFKQFEKDYLSKLDNSLQKQTQNNYSAERPASPKTPQPKTSAAQANRPTVNNLEYQKTQQHIPQKRLAAKKRKRRRPAVIYIAGIMIILITVLLIVKSCASDKDVLSGIWNLDGITVYQFDGKGNGSLNLPENTYPFTYEISDNSLSIDFESDAARDVTYTFAVEKTKLVLVSAEKNKETIYELTKKTGK